VSVNLSRVCFDFPEVFEVSLAQSVERAASEAKAARSDVDVIKGAAESMNKLELPYKDKGKGPGMSSKTVESSLLLIHVESQVATTRPQKHSFPRTNISVSSLYPIYLPLNTQHRLLVKVQAILENACYAFVHQIMPGICRAEYLGSSVS
jgi:hypothetical protein